MAHRRGGVELRSQYRTHGQHALHHPVDVGGLGLQSERIGVDLHLQHRLEAQWRLEGVVVEAADLVYRIVFAIVDTIGVRLRLEIDLRDRADGGRVDVREVDIDELLHDILDSIQHEVRNGVATTPT